MINFNKHIKCVQCGKYNVKNKYINYNNLEQISYKDLENNEFIDSIEYKERIDKDNFICQNCNYIGTIDNFEIDKYRINEKNNVVLANRHYFKCICNEVSIEEKNTIELTNDTLKSFNCKSCGKEYSRDEFNSRIKYLTPTEIEHDADLKTAFEQLNNTLIESFGEMLHWDNEKNDWTYVAKVD